MANTKEIKPSLQKAAEILVEARKGTGLADFPFESKLSMKPLINRWLNDFRYDGDPLDTLRELIGQYAEKHPSIMSAYPDSTSLVRDHYSMLNLLFSSIFPVALSENIYGYAAPPFRMEPFYITTGLQNLLTNASAELRYEPFSEFDRIPYPVRACLIILEKYYKLPHDHMLPFLFSLKSEGNNMERFYKATSMLDFVEVKVRGIAPELTTEKLDYLLNHLNDANLWLQVFSPDTFYFEGLYLALMNEVTEVETLSRLRKLLLTSDSFLDYDTAKMVADLTRVYLSMAEVEVGIFALDYPFENSMAHRYEIHYPIIDNQMDYLLSRVEDNIYEKACRENRMQIISNLEQPGKKSHVEVKYLERGFKSLLVIPLRDHRKNVIGVLELASPQPHAFTHVKRLKLKEILPLYDVSVEDSRNAVVNNIQNVIQEQFTNIHPSVLWKFYEVAFSYLNNQGNSDELRQIEPVSFHDLYPIFGQIDINSSTAIRNKAVKTDLVKNLYLIGDVLDKAYSATKFHLLRKFSFEVSRILNDLKSGFDISQETMVNDLLIREVHPVLKQMSVQYPELTTIIAQYFDALDPKLEIIYEGRKAYEYSLNRINHIISRHLEQEENINQKIIPHYFEKYKTDGIEYTMYVGQSILQKDTFSIHQLHNLRLWQLYSMVNIYHQLEDVRPALPVDMTVSFLILVFNSPLNIVFRLEEKRFDVDGSYHARYEILKKRIDKAHLAGSTERLTKRDKLVIVYMYERDKEEYLQYLQFLIDENLLEPEIEDLEVERVQGVQGVKALRAGFRRAGKSKVWAEPARG